MKTPELIAMSTQESEKLFLLMSLGMNLGFIGCVLLFIIYGQGPNRYNRLDNIVNTFMIVIMIYVVLSIHILHPTRRAKYMLHIIIGYIIVKLINNIYYKHN